MQSRSISWVLAALCSVSSMAVLASSPHPFGSESRKQALFKQADRQGTARVIVTFDDHPPAVLRSQSLQGRGPGDHTETAEQRRQRIKDRQDELLNFLWPDTRGALTLQMNDASHNARVSRLYNQLPGMAVQLTKGEMENIATLPGVSIRENKQAKPQLNTSIKTVGANTRGTFGSLHRGYSGAGQVVVIIDDGAYSKHEFLAPRVIPGACFSTNDRDDEVEYVTSCSNGKLTQKNIVGGSQCNTYGRCFHGTHVAGIAAGRNTDTTTIDPSVPVEPRNGIAQNAAILAINVSTLVKHEGEIVGDTFFYSDMLAGLDHVLEVHPKHRIAAVNMSLGSYEVYTSSCDKEDPLMAQAITQLKLQGIATVVAAGNHGQKDALAFPACLSSAISVGATDDHKIYNTKYESIAPFSNTPNPPNFPLFLLAPGVEILSSLPFNEFSDRGISNYGRFEGTSMAAPFVTGAWAVLKQADPSASVEAILAALQATGVKITKGGPPRTGFPRIQIDQALPQFIASGNKRRIPVIVAHSVMQ